MYLPHRSDGEPSDDIAGSDIVAEFRLRVGQKFVAAARSGLPPCHQSAMVSRGLYQQLPS